MKHYMKTPFLILMGLILLLMLPGVALAQDIPLAALTEAAGTPGLDETAPAGAFPVPTVAAVQGEQGDDLPDATTGLTLAFLSDVYGRMADYLDRQTAITYIVIAGAVLAVIFTVYKTRDRLPAELFKAFQALSQDALMQLARSNEARIEAAKQTQTPIDDAAYQLIGAFLGELQKLVTPAVASALLAAQAADGDKSANQFAPLTNLPTTVEAMAVKRAAEKYGGTAPASSNPDGAFG